MNHDLQYSVQFFHGDTKFPMAFFYFKDVNTNHNNAGTQLLALYKTVKTILLKFNFKETDHFNFHDMNVANGPIRVVWTDDQAFIQAKMGLSNL